MTKIAILGGGSWGTALSIVLSRSHKPHDISLWMRDAALAASVQQSRENDTYLPGCRIPVGLHITGDLAAAVEKADILVGAIPSAHAREIYARSLAFVGDVPPVFVSATKGLEPSTHLRMSEVLAQVFVGDLRASTHCRPLRPVLCAGSGAR